MQGKVPGGDKEKSTVCHNVPTSALDSLGHTLARRCPDTGMAFQRLEEGDFFSTPSASRVICNARPRKKGKTGM